jgi:hypothetical protein
VRAADVNGGAVLIVLPLTERQAVACCVAADALGVEPWRIAVHVLALRDALRSAAP